MNQVDPGLVTRLRGFAAEWCADDEGLQTILTDAADALDTALQQQKGDSGCRCVCHQYPEHAKLQDALEALKWHQEQLSTAVREREALKQKWQPIETAPKDREILVYDEGAIVISGWYSPEVAWWDNGMMNPAPTHWMPLPASPTPEDPS